MLQRIQTIYLALALLSQLAQFFLPWVEYYVNGTETGVSALELDGSHFTVMPLTFVLSLSLGLVLGSIFGFKNRAKQMKTARMALISTLLGFLAFAFIHYMNIQALDEMGELMMTYQLTTVLPLASAILIWLAIKGIKKDDDLIRSVDRLR